MMQETQTMKYDAVALSLKAGVASFLFVFAVFLCLIAFPSLQTAVADSSSTNCADTVLATSISEAETAAYSRELAVVFGAGKDTLQAQADNPIVNGRGSVGKKFCIDNMMTFFKSLQQVLDGDLVGAIVNVILAMLGDILNQVCSLVKQAITNALKMICLPLPDLSLSLKLPGLNGVSCSGVSLADYVTIVPGAKMDLTGASVPTNLSSVPLSVVAPSRTGTSLFGKKTSGN